VIVLFSCSIPANMTATSSRIIVPSKPRDVICGIMEMEERSGFENPVGR
jgi:hypothetical protein